MKNNYDGHSRCFLIINFYPWFYNERIPVKLWKAHKELLLWVDRPACKIDINDNDNDDYDADVEHDHDNNNETFIKR